jgi:hypothetical protein
LTFARLSNKSLQYWTQAIFCILLNVIVQNIIQFKIWSLKNHSFLTVKFHLRVYQSFTQCWAMLDEQKCTKWGQEPLCAQNCPIFRLNPTHHPFEQIFNKMLIQFSRIRQYLTWSSERLTSYAAFYIFLMSW